MSPLATVITVVGSVLGGGGFVALVNAFARKKLTKADVADRLSDSTLRWVEQFQEEAASARREASDMRREAAEARREASEARAEWRASRAEWQTMRQAMQREMRALVDQIRRVRAAAWSPNATIEKVRAVIAEVAAEPDEPA